MQENIKNLNAVPLYLPSYVDDFFSQLDILDAVPIIVPAQSLTRGTIFKDAVEVVMVPKNPDFRGLLSICEALGTAHYLQKGWCQREMICSKIQVTQP